MSIILEINQKQYPPKMISFKCSYQLFCWMLSVKKCTVKSVNVKKYTGATKVAMWIKTVWALHLSILAAHNRVDIITDFVKSSFIILKILKLVNLDVRVACFISNSIPERINLTFVPWANKKQKWQLKKYYLVCFVVVKFIHTKQLEVRIFGHPEKQTFLTL